MAVTDLFPIADWNLPTRRDVLPALTRVWQAEDGSEMYELMQPPRARWEISLLGQTWNDLKPLFRWINQFAGGEIFTFHDPGLNRGFTVRLKSGLPTEEEFLQWINTTIILEEALAEPMLEWPSGPTIFQEETEAIPSGAWSDSPATGRQVGVEGQNPIYSNELKSTVIGNSLTFTYGGYGFRVWAHGAGTVEIYLNGESLGTFSIPPGVHPTNAAYANFSVPLGVNVVKVKHGAAGDVYVDALEYVYCAPT